MKKILISLLAAAAVLTACQPKEVVPELTLTSDQSVAVPTDGGIFSVEFTSNVAWTASIDNKDWSITPTSGMEGNGKVKVSAPENTTPDAVSAKVTISAKGDVKTETKTVEFTQLQKDGIAAESPAEVDYKAQDVNVSVLANVEYTAVIPDAAKSWIQFKEIVATKGNVATTLVLSVAANSGEAREAEVTIKANEGVAQTAITVKQAAFVPQFELDGYSFAVSKDGGEFTVNIKTNVEFTVKDYSDGSFPWQHATLAGDNKSLKVVIDANTGYDARQSYVKFTVPAIKDEEGNDLTVRVYFDQEGLPCIKYSISMYDAAFDTWGTTVMSEAIYNGKHYVSNGQELYEINPADGAYKKIDWPWGNGMTQKVITNDDAGNLIVCNHTAYTDAYLDGYFILNVVTPAGEEKNLITKAAWECGGPFGAKLKVRGDITSDALIVAPVEGIVDVTMSMTVGYWEVKGGVAGDYTQLTASGFVGTWGAGAWNTYPNNFPTIVAKGVNASEGFVMSGCYEENAVYAIDGTTGACYKMLTPELYVDVYDLNGNLACQSISMTSVGGKTYLAMLASPHFPSYGPGWSGAPYLSILEVPATLPASPLNMWTDAKLVKICTSYFPWEADPATDWAISVAADVNLFDSNGKIGVNVVDLNGRCIESYEFDPAVL